MRLIDADSLKQKFMSDAFREMVDDEPTAYDVEKVVEQLKDNSKIYCEEYHQREGSLYIQDVVEIVRNGGTEKYPDPTAEAAIRNYMQGKRKGKGGIP